MIISYMDRLFKRLVITQIILLPIFILSVIYETVPDEILNHAYFDSILDDINNTILIFLAVIYLANFVSMFLIYFFKPIGRPIYFWTWIILILYLLTGPVVYDGVGSFLSSVDMLLTGAILVFIYYTPIKDNFIK